MAALLAVLHWVNVVLVVVVLAKGFLLCPAPADRTVVLLLAVAVTMVAPVEELLVRVVRRRHPAPPEPRVALVDKVTSALFLALVLAAFVRLC